MRRHRHGRWGIAARLAPGLALAAVAAGCLWYVGPQTAGAAVVGGEGNALHDITQGNAITISTNAFEGTVGTFLDTDGSGPTDYTVNVTWGDGTTSDNVPYGCTPVGSGFTTWHCTVFGAHYYEGGGTHQVTLIVYDFDESGYVVIRGGVASGTTTTSKAPCIPYTHFCQSRTAQSGQTVSVTSEGVTAKTVGRGGVAVGTYGKSPTVPAASSTGKFFGVQLSSSNGFTSLVVRDCSLGGGTHLEWWNGSAWAPVVGTTTASNGCLSVTLGTKSSPSLATIAKLSRLTRLEAVAFAVTK